MPLSGRACVATPLVKQVTLNLNGLYCMDCHLVYFAMKLRYPPHIISLAKI